MLLLVTNHLCCIIMHMLEMVVCTPAYCFLCQTLYYKKIFRCSIFRLVDEAVHALKTFQTIVWLYKYEI